MPFEVLCSRTAARGHGPILRPEAGVLGALTAFAGSLMGAEAKCASSPASAAATPDGCSSVRGAGCPFSHGARGRAGGLLRLWRGGRGRPRRGSGVSAPLATAAP